MKGALKSTVIHWARKAGYDIVRRDHRRDAIVSRAPGAISRFTEGDVDYAFFVARPDDVIQSEHARGALYEPEELALIGAHLPDDAVFIDIGANVGNHSVAALLGMGVRRAILFEPTLFAHTILSFNLALNGLEDRVEVHKLCLSDREGEVRIEMRDPDNLGGAAIDARDRGELVPMRRGDSILTPCPSAFLKIDVERHEMAVLAGLARFVAEARPPVFIEVDDVNAARFLAWCEAQGYRVAERFRRYRTNENFLVLPAT